MMNDFTEYSLPGNCLSCYDSKKPAARIRMDSGSKIYIDAQDRSDEIMEFDLRNEVELRELSFEEKRERGLSVLRVQREPTGKETTDIEIRFLGIVATDDCHIIVEVGGCELFAGYCECVSSELIRKQDGQYTTSAHFQNVTHSEKRIPDAKPGQVLVLDSDNEVGWAGESTLITADDFYELRDKVANIEQWVELQEAWAQQVQDDLYPAPPPILNRRDSDNG